MADASAMEIVVKIPFAFTVNIQKHSRDGSVLFDWSTDRGEESGSLFATLGEAIEDAMERFYA